MKRKLIMLVAATGFVTVAYAEEKTVEMHMVSSEGVGDAIGSVAVTKTPWGVLFTPDLSELPPGLHGFHVHQDANCEPARDEGEIKAAMAAGSHYDPQETGRHEGPYGNGHLGDLPGLYVDSGGNALHPVLAPRLRMQDLDGRALMIHVAGDNYSDQPVELGGGGSRMACGPVE